MYLWLVPNDDDKNAIKKLKNFFISFTCIISVYSLQSTVNRQSSIVISSHVIRHRTLILLQTFRPPNQLAYICTDVKWNNRNRMFRVLRSIYQTAPQAHRVRCMRLHCMLQLLQAIPYQRRCEPAKMHEPRVQYRMDNQLLEVPFFRVVYFR